MNSFYYLALLTLLLVAIFQLYRNIDREMMYFRFCCENIFDIDYYDYVNNYKFFHFFNDQLSEHLKLYVQARFHEAGIPYKDLQLSAQVEYETITIACYLEASLRRHNEIQDEIIKTVDLEAQIRQFFEFYDKARAPEYQNLFRFKEKKEIAPQCSV